MNTTSDSLLRRDLISPTMAALISVIVNYGGTFFLVSQAAKVALLGVGGAFRDLIAGLAAHILIHG